MVPTTYLGMNNYYRAAKEVRGNFKGYFSPNGGIVSWQLDHVTCTMDPFDDLDAST